MKGAISLFNQEAGKYPSCKQCSGCWVKCMLLLLWLPLAMSAFAQNKPAAGREVIRLSEGWHFKLFREGADSLVYDLRPEVTERNDDKVADSKPTEALRVAAAGNVLKPWILPTANDFISDPAKRHQRPEGNPGGDFPFVQNGFHDKDWEAVRVPHDWAIKGPFYTGNNPVVGGGMGRLPIQGVGWYRRKLDVPQSDKGKSIYLDIEGAMSYAMVWLNGQLVGGWPYGYNSFRLDLTPYVRFGGDNQLAIRIDNPNHSARWYPGAGLYRDVWLSKVAPVQVAQWGSFITTPEVSKQSALLDLELTLANHSEQEQAVEVRTDVYLLDAQGKRSGLKTSFPKQVVQIAASGKIAVKGEARLANPFLWGPPPTQKPNRYVAVSSLFVAGKLVDRYETPFGVRSLKFDRLKGLLVNGSAVRIQGVNQHHDLGAIGAAFNRRAAERQLELLQELGCNAIRISHNPPAPGLLALTDSMGFLVVNEIFDSWERKKTPHDFHLIFPDWHEPDTRAFIRRDRNHPSVIAWSFGNEVGEQYTDTAGARIAKRLYNIVREEDSTRPATASMNYAKPDMPFPATMDILSLNYQGEGIRDAPAYAHLKGIRTSPLYPAFKNKFPDKPILSSETASALSTRGTYLFPVAPEASAPVSDGVGGDAKTGAVSAYELYTAAFGASADKVFASQDKHPYVAGEFVWTGWDYLGEPTPFYTARSSYSGIIDLAGFKKDRFYLYQSRWRPNLPMVHLLPHWNWPERVGQVTPVHVFTSGDAAELFLNGKTLGKKKKSAYEYRLRWDSVLYQPGELKVIAYRNGRKWAEETIRTTGAAAQLQLHADRKSINGDGEDMVFITATVRDANGLEVHNAAPAIRFSVEGPAEIVATDNGDPADLVAFASTERKAFSGKVLVIVRAKTGAKGRVVVRAVADGLKAAVTEVQLTKPNRF